MTMGIRFIDAEAKMRSDIEGLDIYMSAIEAVNNARKDGQSSGKHSPESWKEETILTQIEHANQHTYEAYTAIVEPEESDTKDLLQEAEHALCRLAIAIALYKRSQQNG